MTTPATRYTGLVRTLQSGNRIPGGALRRILRDVNRTAGKLLEVDHVTAWRWLFLLTHDGVVEEVEKGDRTKRRASRYRYCGD